MTTRFFAYVRGLVGRHRIEKELQEELQFHLDQEIQAHVARGLSAVDAQRAALRDFGGVTQTTESVRDLRTTWVESVWRDVRYAVRRLGREPGFTLAAVLTLALGIGANTAIFSVVDALMLRRLPVREPDRLVLVTPGGERAAWTNPLWEEFHRRQHVLDGVFAWSTSGIDPTRGKGFDLSSGGVADLASGLWVSGDFFDVLGVQPALGRTLRAADDVKGGGADGPVAVISDAFWQRRFAGSADVVGKRLSIEGVPFTIVGVTPPGFLGPDVGAAFEVAIPLGTLPLVARRDRLQQRSWWFLTVMGRLKPGQTAQGAAAALASLQPQLRDATRPSNMRPEDAANYLNTPIGVAPSPAGPSSIRDAYQQPLSALMAVVALILLIACVNIANLLLARADARRHEVTLRLALGASRGRLVRQCLVESLVLAALGAVFGFGLAEWASRWLVAQLSTGDSPVVLDLSLDARVLAFTAGLTVAVALLFGLVPALRATKAPPIDAIKERRLAAGAGHGGVGSMLVTLQVTLSLVLVVASMLFVRTFATLTDRHPGFDTDRVLIVNVDARRSAHPPAARLALYTRLLEDIRALPGVAEASLSAVIPVSNNEWDTIIENSSGLSLSESERRVEKNVVRPHWFATYGTPFVAGRDFTAADLTQTPTAVIINEALARRFFGGVNAIGHTLREVGDPTDSAPALTIVGVVKDAVYLSLRDVPPPTMYVPMAYGMGSISVRVQAGSPAHLVPSVTAAIVGADRDLALTIHLLADNLRVFVARERLLALLSAFFGVLALLLAGLGLYGVVSHAVGARRTEIGIRIALGASAASVVGLVVRRVAVQVGLGLLLGVPASVWGGQFASALLFGVEPRDPVMLASAVLALVTVGVAASWLPARRAARVDPALTLRAD